MLDTRRLNRTLLARQLLLRRSERTVADALGHLVGLQSQNPGSPYLALHARLEGFDPADVSALLVDRRAVRIVLQRSTVHLVLAEDALTLRPLVGAVSGRGLLTSWGRFLEGLDLDAVAAAGRALVDAEPRPMAELGALLQERWPDRDGPALAQVVRAHVPLVQVPPRGVWGASGRPTVTSVEAWLGRALEPRPAVEDLVRRYLAAFGPATVADLRAWSGLTGLREVVEAMRPGLRTERGDGGAELFDVPDGVLADGDEPAPPRFLPDYDNLLLSHADRARVLRPEDGKGPIGTPTVLVDGFVAGTWKVERARGSATLVVVPFGRLSRVERLDVAEEGARLLALSDPGAAHDVRFGGAEPPPRSHAAPGARSRGGPSRGAGRRG